MVAPSLFFALLILSSLLSSHLLFNVVTSVIKKKKAKDNLNLQTIFKNMSISFQSIFATSTSLNILSQQNKVAKK